MLSTVWLLVSVEKKINKITVTFSICGHAYLDIWCHQTEQQIFHVATLCTVSENQNCNHFDFLIIWEKHGKINALKKIVNQKNHNEIICIILLII
jgi:hypothetical protein